MAGSGGKGRASSELVAASCAAILAVYGAGYWRTRDEARRIDTRAQERRPARPEQSLTVAAPVVEKTAVAMPQLPAATALPSSPSPGAVIAPVAEASTEAVTAQSAPIATQTSGLSAVAAITSAEPAVAVAVSSVKVPEAASEPTSDVTPAAEVGWRDGTYTGWGTSRHGDIKAQVVIRNGRIVESSIASCETRYPCDVISDIIRQPVARQNPEVDRVSRATESADAYYFGLVEALAQALETPAQATPR